MRFVPLVLIALALLLILLILLKSVDVKLQYSRELTVRIDFTLISLILKKGKQQRGFIKNSLKIIRNLPYLIKAADYLIRRSHISVYKALSDESVTSPSEFFKRLPSFISYSAIYTYLNNTAKTVSYYNNSTNSNISFNPDIIIRLKPIDMIISSLLFLYYKVKSKFRRVIKNV